MKKKTLIALLEDDLHTQRVIARTVSQTDDLELRWVFNSAEDALNEFKDPIEGDKNSPDIFLTRIHLPGISGIDATPHLIRLLPTSKVIILTHSQQKSDVLSAAPKGIHGYLLKSSSASAFANAVRNVARGKVEIDPSIAAHLLEAVSSAKRHSLAAGSDVLSSRETQVLELISEGMMRKEIARTLCISENTVVFHINNIYEKLEVHNAPSAVAMAFRLGILSHGSPRQLAIA